MKEVINIFTGEDMENMPLESQMYCNLVNISYCIIHSIIVPIKYCTSFSLILHRNHNSVYPIASLPTPKTCGKNASQVFPATCNIQTASHHP